MPDRVRGLGVRFGAGRLPAFALHGLAYWAFVLLVAPSAVGREAWAVLYLAGVAALSLWLREPASTAARRRAVEVLGYSMLLGVWFFGADRGLAVLGNSVRPRQALPGFLHGLELYYLLVPGVATVALGRLAATCRLPKR